MATNSELLDEAMSRLGQRSSTRIRADVLAEINNTITRIERGTFFPWFLETTGSLNVVANDTSVSLPTDFALEQEETRPYYTADGTLYYLEKVVSLAMLQQTAGASRIKYYALNGGTFHFRAAADESLTIYLPYYAKETGDLVDNSSEVSNLWLLNAKEWILGESLARVAAFHLRNPDLAALQQMDAQTSKRDLYIYHESRIHQNQDYYAGGATNYES